ncbi:hypothetical protein GCM10010260_72650 [Streptomyces filipinensis]|uniref:Uncharacterized protein n=1 Tax=Streptomyces filipinensis TaxID=66887 RepID=A0A918IJS6_9ACTN|nr:hypothetical protein GCM10010260_72650 [Streptomyces filipinensis]
MAAPVGACGCAAARRAPRHGRGPIPSRAPEHAAPALSFKIKELCP